MFRCPYHAWSFNNQGDLSSVPDRDSYGDKFDMHSYSLHQPACLDHYRGFFFICFDSKVESLKSYLAGAVEHLDLILDQGEMEIVSGEHKYDIGANWKLLMENSFDGYHLMPTHKTYLDYVKSQWSEMPKPSEGVGLDLGNGHAAIEFKAFFGKPIALWSPLFGDELKLEINAIKQQLIDKYGNERGNRMCENGRIILIFPNLIVIDAMGVAIRVPQPLTTDRMQVSAWQLALKAESSELRTSRLKSYLSFLGPGGFSTPDDVEMLEACQAGFKASSIEWSDASRGMHKQQPAMTDEFHIRTFWRNWQRQLSR